MTEIICEGVGSRGKRWGQHAIVCPTCGLYFSRQRCIPVHEASGPERASVERGVR